MGLLQGVHQLISPLTSPLSPDRAGASYKALSAEASPTYRLEDLEGAESDDHAALIGHQDGSSTDGGPGRTTYAREARVLGSYMAPLLISLLVQRYCAMAGPVAAAGKFGPAHLAGAALGNTTLNILFVAPTYGVTSALDTLSTQAHGQKDKTRDLNMLYSLRVFLVLSGSMIFFVPLMLNSGYFFSLLGVEEDVSQAAATYMRWASLGVPGWVIFEVLRKYIQAQGKMFGPAVAGMVAVPITIPIMHSGIFGSNTPGIGLAVYYNMTCLAGIWATLFLPKTTWADLPSLKLVCQDLGIVCKLGAAGTISTCSDWWAWEYLSFCSAWMGPSQLAANGICVTIVSFLFALPGALMNASATRVGNHLGRDAPDSARVAAFTALGMGLTIATTTSICMALGAGYWTSLYTNDPEVTKTAMEVMPFFSVIVLFDAMQGAYGGILRGAGLPLQIARIMLIAHYGVGLPLATIFAFSRLQWGLLGLWRGFGIGLGLVCSRLTWLTIYNDWHEGARKAQAHIHESDQNAQAAVAAEDF